MSDQYLRELLAVSEKDALTFFVGHLQDEVVSRVTQTQAETFYVASILAHHAIVSRGNSEYMSTSGSLREILDTFVLPGLDTERSAGLQDPEILEVAGSQTLLLVGFFRDQMRKKHNLRWYANLGSSFFQRAGDGLRHGDKSDLLLQVGENFELWAQSCYQVSRTLRYDPYLLKL